MKKRKKLGTPVASHLVHNADLVARWHARAHAHVQMSSNLTAVRSCSAPHWVHTHRGFPPSLGQGSRSASQQKSKVVQRVAVAARHAHQARQRARIAGCGILPKGVDAVELQRVVGKQPDFFLERSRQSEHRTGKFGEFDGRFGEGEV
jgi:hypothetical protein